MTMLRRVVEVLTWKHVAWTLAIVVVWKSVGRIGMVGNAVDRMTAASWLFDVTLGLSSAVIYLAAVVVAEAASAGRSGTPLKNYVFAVLAAGAIVLASRPLLPDFYPRTYAGPENRVAFERAVKLVSNPAGLRRQKIMDGAEGVVFFSLVTFVYAGMRRSRSAWRALADAELARSEAQRALVAAQLGSAQALADPARVLDRLSEIEAMYDRDCARADAMMDELIAFLRAAVPRLRMELAPASGP